MNQQAASEPIEEADLEADVDTVIAACGGSERAAIRALLIANEYLGAEVERLRASQSAGYVRARQRSGAHPESA
jgi:hypothetical protein